MTPEEKRAALIAEIVAAAPPLSERQQGVIRRALGRPSRTETTPLITDEPGSRQRGRRAS